MAEQLTARVVDETRSREVGAAPEQKLANGASRRPRWFLFVADIGVAQSFCLLALIVAGHFGLGRGIAPSHSLPILLATLFPVLVGLSGLYQHGYFSSWRRQASIGVHVLAWSIGISVGGVFLFAQEISWDLRAVVLIYQGLLGVWLLAVRPMVALLLQRHFAAALPTRVLLVGADQVACDVARSLAEGSGQIEILGFAYPERPTRPQIAPFFHTALESMPDLVGELGADLVVVARPDLARERVIRLSDELVAGGCRVHVVSNVFNRLVDSVPFETDTGVPLVAVGQTPLRGNNVTLKRVIDLFGTILGGVMISPLLLLIALLVKFSSPGPVLYRQRRVGKNGKEFAFYKFRTMRVANDDSVHREYIKGLVQNGEAAGADKSGNKIYKMVDDPRVTAIGRFLRRTSLDELPQLINVLRGEMSLVGPRPCLPFEYDLYRDWQKRRLDVTPGMTGLWQVTGRSYVSFEDMVLLDLFYIANWAFPMDLRILFRTIPVVIWGKGGG